MLEKWQEQPRI